MSYSISYGSDKDLIRFQKKRYYGLIFFTFIAALIVGIRVFLPNVFSEFINLMNPLDKLGIQAFHIMIDDVRQGIPVGEAMDAFCRSIVENANIWN